MLSVKLENDLASILEMLTGRKDLSVLSARSERVLVQADDLVLKVHAPGMKQEALNNRLQVIVHEPLSSIFLKPIRPTAISVREERLVTVWPKGRALQGEDDLIPWSEGARLLAWLHSIPVHASQFSFELPRSRARGRVEEAITKLFEVPLMCRDKDWETIRSASETIDLAESNKLCWTHGDWHLGQLVNFESEWRFIDMEDMGLGEAVWDLARPAAFYAAGLLAPGDWECFIETYRELGGAALADKGDVWTFLESPARAMIVQSAAHAFIKSRAEDRAMFEDESLLLESCRRIARLCA